VGEGCYMWGGEGCCMWAWTLHGLVVGSCEELACMEVGYICHTTSDPYKLQPPGSHQTTHSQATTPSLPPCKRLIHSKVCNPFTAHHATLLHSFPSPFIGVISSRKAVKEDDGSYFCTFPSAGDHYWPQHLPWDRFRHHLQVWQSNQSLNLGFIALNETVKPVLVGTSNTSLVATACSVVLHMSYLCGYDWL